MTLRRWRFYVFWPGLFVYFRLNQHRSRTIIRCGDEILLIRDNGRFGGREDLWTLPGGGIGQREDDAEAAAREVREELGVDLRPHTLIHIGEKRVGQHGLDYLAQFFLVDIIRKPMLDVSSWEVREAAWFPVDEAAHLPQKPELTTALELLAAKQ